MSLKIDEEKAKGNIKVILDKVHKDTDLALLREYRRIYKKEISLFSRRWAAAWLFMYYDQRETPPLKNEKQSMVAKRKNITEEEKSSSTTDISLSEEESKRLFISIGKNRHLFPREIISLIMSKTSSLRGDIGLIRILDNYSFVQVRDTKADEIIEVLNGIKFRGRTLTLNYAKSKTNNEEQ